MRPTWTWSLAALLAIAVLATVSTITFLSKNRETLSVPSDMAVEEELVWLANGSLYVLVLKASSEGADELWTISEGNDMEKLDPSQAFGCQPQELISIFTLEHRLGIVGRCTNQSEYSIIATKPKEWSETDLIMTSRVPVYDVTYFPGMSYGFAVVNIGYCRMLVSLQPDLKMFFHTRSDGSLNLKQKPYPFDNAASTCEAHENLGPLSFAAGAGVMLVGVTNGAAGKFGSRRYNVPTDVVAFAPEDDAAVKKFLPFSVQNISSIESSSDAEMVVIGTSDFSGGGELLLFDQHEKTSVKLREGNAVSDAAFSPELDELAVIYSTRGDRVIEKLDITSFL